MPLKVPTAGEDAMLSGLLGKTTPAALTLKLFTNNITPTDAHTAASFTEMTGQGYVAKTLSPAVWTIAQTAGVSVATYIPQTWLFGAGGPATIYGYFVVGADGVIRWAERLSAAFTAEVLNDSLTITPTISLNSEA